MMFFRCFSLSAALRLTVPCMRWQKRRRKVFLSNEQHKSGLFNAKGWLFTSLQIETIPFNLNREYLTIDCCHFRSFFCCCFVLCIFSFGQLKSKKIHSNLWKWKWIERVRASTVVPSPLITFIFMNSPVATHLLQIIMHKCFSFHSFSVYLFVNYSFICLS